MKCAINHWSTKIHGDQGRLEELVILSIQANRLVSMAGVGRKEKLGELYVSQNGIQAATELANFPNLKTLDIGYNRLEELPTLPTDIRYKTSYKGRCNSNSK